MIRLQTLGVLDLRSADGAELRAVLAQPKRLALLIYLAAGAPHGFHRRDTILALFWPERDLESARASLSRAVYFLRHELGAGILLSRGDEEIGLDHERFWCDAAAFDDAVRGGKHHDAIDLYRGDLLPGFFVSDAAGFEGWLETQRTRLRESASGAAWQLANEHEAAGDFAAAAQWARRGVELAPFREAAFRRLLALLDRTGDRAGAAHAYEKFAVDIARELDIAPSPETRTLIDAIRTRTVGLSAESVTREPGVQGEASNAEPVLAAPHAAPTIPARRRRLSTRAVIVVAAGAVLLAAAGIGLVAMRRRPIDPLQVDVAPWTNRTGDRALDRLGTLAAERIIADIRRVGVVKNSRMTRRWSSTRAGTLVTGDVERVGNMLRFHARITDVQRGGKPWALTPRAVSISSPEQAIDSMRPHVLGAVAVLRDPTVATLFPIATPPPTFDAYHEFLEGAKLQAQGQIVDGLKHFRWAAAIDSSFTWSLVHAGMACMNWYRADMTAQTDSILASLRLVHSRLTPLQSHLVDHMSAVRTEDWAGSYRAMRAAADLAPNQFGFAFSTMANQANRPGEAVDALTRPGMDSIYRRVPTYWRRLTFSLHLLGEHQRELAIARRARAIDGQSVLAMVEELRALAALGRLPETVAGVDTLMSLPREGWLTAGYAVTWVAKELRAHGHTAAAARAMNRALDWYRSRPSEERASQEWRESFAEELYLAGDWAAADSAYRSLTRDFRTSAGYPDNAFYLGRVGAIAARRGDSATARAMADKLVATDRYQPLPGRESRLYRAKIALLLGDRPQALRLLVAAYGATGTIELHDDLDFEGMKDYAPYQEFVRSKG